MLQICSHCGAVGHVFSKCEYCGSQITMPHYINDGSHSLNQSWSDFRLDGFSLVPENTEGGDDCQEFQVIRGDRTGKQGLIDRSGNFIIPCIYDSIKANLKYQVCCIAKCGHYGVISFDEKEIISLSDSEPYGFVIQYGLIIGRYSIYDISGNLKIKLDSKHGILLLSSLWATRYSDCYGIFNVNTGKQILSCDYKVVKLLNKNIFLVSKFSHGVTRYGIFNADTKELLLPTEYLSIQCQDGDRFIAKMQSTNDQETTVMKTLIFKVKDGKIVIEKEEKQMYQIGSGTGCMLILILAIILPVSFFILL